MPSATSASPSLMPHVLAAELLVQHALPRALENPKRWLPNADPMDREERFSCIDEFLIFVEESPSGTC